MRSTDVEDAERASTAVVVAITRRNDEPGLVLNYEIPEEDAGPTIGFMNLNEEQQEELIQFAQKMLRDNWRDERVKWLDDIPATPLDQALLERAFENVHATWDYRMAATVLYLRYCAPGPRPTQTQVAVKLGLTKQRISAIESKALFELMSPILDVFREEISPNTRLGFALAKEFEAKKRYAEMVRQGKIGVKRVGTAV